jgi:hypothetical protein
MNIQKPHFRQLFFVFALAFLFHSICAGLTLTKQSGTPQYVYLAYSFLHRKVNLIELPQKKFDLIEYQKKWYVPGGMTPALVMIPFVAIFGLNFSDIFFGVLIASINVALMYFMLGYIEGMSPQKRNWLTVLFAAGTVHWWVSNFGNVWFNAQTVSVMFMILYVIETLTDKRPWLAGFWLGCSVLSRPPTLFAATFFLVYSLWQARWQVIEAAKKIIPFMLTFSFMLGIMLVYNQIRFGSPLNFGYDHLAVASPLVDVEHLYGTFKPAFMPCNIYISLFGLPNFPAAAQLSDKLCWHLTEIGHDFPAPYQMFDPRGLSIFLTTPALLYIFKARLRELMAIAAVIGIISVLPVDWMYHTTGLVQFGYRYILDVIPFLFILLAIGMKNITIPARLLIFASIAMNFVGFALMFSYRYEMTWFDMWFSNFK